MGQPAGDGVGVPKRHLTVALSSRDKPPNLIANPLSHTAGVVRLLFALYVGRRIVLLRKFNGAVAHRLIRRHGVDNLTINPAMIRMLIDQVEPGADLAPVALRVVGNRAATRGAARGVRGAIRDFRCLQAYGQTEAFGGNRHRERRRTCCLGGVGRLGR